MSRLARALAQTLDSLGALEVRAALVGGLAVSARTEPRFTRDLDLAVAVRDDAETEALLGGLMAAGFRVLSTVEQDATARLATARLTPPGESDDELVVDLLFASSGIEPEVVAAADPLELFPGLTVPVATRGHLLALKALSLDDATRPQDRLDALALGAGATPTDLQIARHALATIAERGFARQQDLPGKLDRLLAQVPSV
jgi:hypothetical protein